MRLPDHRLINNPTKIKCKDRQSTFISDESRKTILIHPESQIENVSLSEAIVDNVIELENMVGVSMKLTTNKNSPIHPLTLLQIISRVKAPLYDLNQIHEHGNGNFLAGLGMFFGHIFKAAVKGAGKLLNSVGDALVHLFTGVSNGTSKIILASGDGVSKIITSTGNATHEIELGFFDGVKESLGGILPLVNSIFIVLLIVYLLLKNHNRIEEHPAYL